MLRLQPSAIVLSSEDIDKVLETSFAAAAAGAMASQRSEGSYHSWDHILTIRRQRRKGKQRASIGHLDRDVLANFHTLSLGRDGEGGDDDGGGGSGGDGGGGGGDGGDGDGNDADHGADEEAAEAGDERSTTSGGSAAEARAAPRVAFSTGSSRHAVHRSGVRSINRVTSHDSPAAPSLRLQDAAAPSSGNGGSNGSKNSNSNSSSQSSVRVEPSHTDSFDPPNWTIYEDSLGFPDEHEDYSNDMDYLADIEQDDSGGDGSVSEYPEVGDEGGEEEDSVEVGGGGGGGVRISAEQRQQQQHLPLRTLVARHLDGAAEIEPFASASEVVDDAELQYQYYLAPIPQQGSQHLPLPLAGPHRRGLAGPAEEEGGARLEVYQQPSGESAGVFDDDHHNHHHHHHHHHYNHHNHSPNHHSHGLNHHHHHHRRHRHRLHHRQEQSSFSTGSQDPWYSAGIVRPPRHGVVAGLDQEDDWESFRRRYRISEDWLNSAAGGDSDESSSGVQLLSDTIADIEERRHRRQEEAARRTLR